MNSKNLRLPMIGSGVLVLVLASLMLLNGPILGMGQREVLVTMVREAHVVRESGYEGYSPQDLVVVIGVNSTVTWRNDDFVIHNARAANGEFETSFLDEGRTHTHTFTQPGEYEYRCSIHPWMSGKITALSTS